jgi:phosphoribosylanthranilate isomerase
VNLVPTSKRCVDEATASSIAEAVAGAAEVVLVVADLSVSEMLGLRARTGATWLQLHGAEPPDVLAGALPHAFKAVGIADAADVQLAGAYAGERFLADSKGGGGTGFGGSGASFDWRLVRELSLKRRVILAGGLTPDNVAEAVRVARPWGVDVASGVEFAPGKKDPEKVRAFIRAARGESP